MPSLTIVLSGPKASEQQARNALVAAGFDVHPHPYDYGMKPLSDQQAESFVCVTGNDIDHAAATVRSLDWVLRLYHETAEPPPPSEAEVLRAELAELRGRLETLEGGR